MEFVEAIKSLQKQLQYQPELVNPGKLGKFERFIFVGMGGSALGPDLLRTAKPGLDIIVHRDYGLPDLPEQALKSSLIILSSYSGNTEEVLDAMDTAMKKGLSVAAVSIGGKLLEIAKQNGIPHVQIPDWGLEPRLTLGLNIKAILKIIGQEEDLNNILRIDLGDYENLGRDIAEKLKGFVPIIYSSRKNGPIAYSWKVKINETAKKPSFANVFPELNHNEMAGFHAGEVSKLLSQNFYFIFLKDATDRPRILKRMDVLGGMLRSKMLNVEIVELTGEDIWSKIFSSLVLADWVSYYIAKEYNVDPADISAIEEFKKSI